MEIIGHYINRECLNVTVPIGTNKILNEMAKTRGLSKSRLIERMCKGIEGISPTEWTQWETWFKIMEEKNAENH